MHERTPAQRLGDAAEQLVADGLVAAGWTIVARHLRLGRDEIDLLAVDPGPPSALTVVEVRWRGRRDFGLPEETVGWQKRRRLRRSVASLLDHVPTVWPALAHLPIRIDLVAVEPDVASGTRWVRHHRAVEL